MSFKEFIRSRVLPKVNAALSPLSLRLVPASTPNRDFSDFLRHLRTLGMQPRTLIDVGVAQGTPGLYAELQGGTLFLVEPVPSCKPVLDGLARRFGALAFNVAAGAEDGTITLNVHDTPSGSSVYSQLEGEQMDGRPVEVPVRRLDTLLPIQLARPAMLKVDTQGHEIDVMRGAAGLLSQLDVVILECSLHQFRKGAPELAEVVRFMEGIGFRPYETLEGHFRALDRAMAQVDIAFVPDSSPLRQNAAYFSPDQVAAYLKG